MITDSSVSWQGTPLGTEPAAESGWDPSFPRAVCMRDRVLAWYEVEGLNYAALQISKLISQIMYPIPGIWLGPVYVHMPSGNVLLHISVPRGGPYDPADCLTSLTVGDNTYSYEYLYYPSAYGPAEYRIRATDPRGNATMIIHDTNVVQAVISPFGTRTSYVWDGGGDARINRIIDSQGNRTTLAYQNLFDGTRALSEIERPIPPSLARCSSATVPMARWVQ